MKKIGIIMLSLPLLLSSCGGNNEINQEGANIFPYSTKEDTSNIAMGDVMPFFDNGVMNIYHLRDITAQNSLFYHPIARLTTSDFIHYKDEGVALNYVEDITSPDAALGTGSFIKDPEGNYHCFYTGHNDKAHDKDNEGAHLIHTEVIRHAISKDNQNTWQKVDDFLLYGYEDDFRDPYVYFDNVANKYYMLITSRDFGNSVIRRYEASNLNASSSEWVFTDNFFTNDEGTYNMECPSYVEYNGYYYLAYSEQGNNRVTHYRYRDTRDGEWKKFDRDTIDASGFYAGRIEKANNKLYAFAWCAKLEGGNTGGFGWAGNLVTHELLQKDNGELIPVISNTYKDYFNHNVNYTNSNGDNVKNVSFKGEKFEAISLNKLSSKVTRISTTFTTTSDDGDFGFSFGLDNQYNNRLGDGVIAFNLKENKLVCHNNVSNILRYGNELTSVSYQFEKNKEHNVDVVIDGEIISVYLNNEVALTARLINMVDNYFAIYSNKATVDYKEVMFYE